MNKKFMIKTLVGTLTATALIAGAVSFTAITAIADEAVDYYGISADGTVISGTVTDYTKITSADAEWGVEGKETWYVADGDITVGGYDFPVATWGKINIIVKDDARVIVDCGIKCVGSEVTVYSESENGNGVIAFIGKQGQNGDNGSICSGEEASHGKSGYDGYPAIDISKLTVAGGTVTAIGGKGGSGGQAGYESTWINGIEVFYYGNGGNGGNGAYAVTENTEIYLNGGTFNATAGRGGIEGENPHVPSAEQENYRGTPGNSAAAAVKGVYAVNGILNVNKLDDSDENDTTGDYELLPVDGYENAELTLAGPGTAKVTDGTVITTHGDILVSGSLSVDGGMILTNGDIVKSTAKADITKANGGVIRRITPAAGEGYTLDNANGLCDPEYGYNIMLSDGTLTYGFVGSSVIVSENNRLNIVHCGDGDIIDNSEPSENIMPYCFRVNDTPNTVFIGGNVFAEAGTNSSITFALSDPDEYCFSGVTVTDWDGNTVPADKYTFNKQTGEFTAISVDRNMKVAVNAQLKDVEISITDSDGNVKTYYDFGTGTDDGKTIVSDELKVKVTDGGHITKYKVVKESDLDKTTGETTGDTSPFSVFYKNYDSRFWGVSDLSQNDKIGVGDSATFRLSVKSGTKAGTYRETYIVVTDRSEYADGENITADKAVARFTITYNIVHESDNQLHYSDLSGHYNLCVNCQVNMNKSDHIFDLKTVSDDTLAKAATCVQPALYYYSCECGAHSDSQVFDYGEPNGHKFGEWQKIKAPTCTEKGTEKHICSVCKAEEERDTNPLGHDWEDDFTVDKEPTCTVPGSKSIHCLRCDATKDETEIEPNGHKFGEWQESKAPTCTEKGTEKHICLVCRAEEEREITPLGHDWENDFTVDKEPTCTVPGSKSIHCSRCDVTKDETEIEPNGHKFGEWQEIKAPTCTEKGTEKHICSVCKAEEERDINQLGHDWENDFTVDKEPTCTVPGSKSIHCSRCDATKDETEIEPSGHKFGEWETDALSDCTSGGTEKRVCTVCDYTEYRDIAPAEHTWDNDFTIDKEPTCTTSGIKSIHCLKCQVKKDVTEIEAIGHDFTEWTVNKDSTCTEIGQKTRICKVCDYTEYADTDIDSDAHLWEDDFTVDKEPTCIAEGSKSIHCARCGATKDSTVIPVTDHTYGEWKTVTPATCTENGVIKHICTVCGYEQTDVTEAAHEWESARTVDILPSCTEYGEESIHCKNCDARKDIEELSPKGHDWSEWETLVEPTRTSEGKAYKFCYTCGIKEEKMLDKLTDEIDRQYDDKKHWHKDEDGNIIDLEDHEFIWVVDKEPTATEPGIGHYECISCAFEQAPEEFGKRNPETGSESLVVWTVTALIAGTTAPITLRMRKKKNK